MSGKTLIKDAILVTCDEAVDVPPRGDILVDGSSIAAVGSDVGDVDAEVIDGAGMIAIPGLIDSHRHIWQAPIRGTAVDLSFLQYLQTIHEVLVPLFEASDVGAGVRLGAAEALNAGITTTYDYCHVIQTPEEADAAVAALKESGARVVFGHGGRREGTSMPDWMVESELTHPPDVRRVRDEHFPANDGLVTMAMAIRGAEYSTLEVTRADVELARELDLPVTLHIGCGTFGPKYRAVERMGEAGLLDAGMNFVHCSMLADEEFELMAASGVRACFAPVQEMTQGNGPLGLGRLRAAGLRFGLGVDIVTATGGDLFTQMRCALAQERARLYDPMVLGGTDPPEVDYSSAEALNAITIDGAHVCGLEDRVGSLTPGKAADIVLLKQGLNLAPLTDPVASVVSAADISNVDTVFVDGKTVKRNGELVGVDLERLVSDAADTQLRLYEAAGWAEAGRFS